MRGVTDLFALLEQPRRPWLDERAVKDAFHRLASVSHPDRTGGQTDFSADLNGAFVTLRDPVKRLRHFLELEDPSALHETRAIPEDLGKLFPRVATARQTLSSYAARRRGAGSAVARALLAEEERAAKAIALETRTTLDKRLTEAFEELRMLDAKWSSTRALTGLAELYTTLAYLTRWDEQLREATLQCEIG